VVSPSQASWSKEQCLAAKTQRSISRALITSGMMSPRWPQVERCNGLLHGGEDQLTMNHPTFAASPEGTAFDKTILNVPAVTLGITACT
jgi:hypothetical protein